MLVREVHGRLQNLLPHLAFLELTEHNTPHGGGERVANSLTFYEFSGGGKLVRFGVYQQHG